MMTLGPVGFLAPWLLAALLVLPAIWWLLRITPPAPAHVLFPATRLLLGLDRERQDRAHSPWWLTLLRLAAAAAIILALARPVLNPQTVSLPESDLLLVLVDNGWASAADWELRRQAMARRLEQAEQASQQVLVLPTAGWDERRSLNPVSAVRARQQFAGMVPLPLVPERLKAIRRLEMAPLQGRTISLVWLSDGLDHGQAETFTDRLVKIARKAENLTIIRPPVNSAGPFALWSGIDSEGKLQAVVKSPGGFFLDGHVVATDARARVLFQQPVRFLPEELEKTVKLDLPLELRNQISRVKIKEIRSAAANFLIDGRAGRQRIGIISGETSEEAQPLLSPLYYVKKALRPFAEITIPDNRNSARATEKLLSQGASVLILAGIGRLEKNTERRLDDWLRRGGTIIRFAGSRLEQGSDALLPVALRRGGRTLGGALSWSTPQKLSAFEEKSPFYGLALPDDVSVRRQVLADPSRLDDDVLVWARLADGTPLVTAKRSGRGLLVLFHVTANSSWSNLPHSGLFVDMLRRLVALSTGVIAPSQTAKAGLATTEAGAKEETGKGGAPGTGDERHDKNDNKGNKGNRDNRGSDSPMAALPPLQIFDGYGELKPPGIQVEPLKLSALDDYTPGPAHPPGLYGTPGQVHAVNIASKNMKLRPLAAPTKGVSGEYYKSSSSKQLAPLLLTLALVLFLVDGLITISMRRFTFHAARPAGSKSPVDGLASGLFPFLLAGALLSFHGGPAMAAPAQKKKNAPDLSYGLKMSLETHLAYVKTGNRDIDRISLAGLKALSRTIARRTAFEPSDPVGVDISRDELAFFPLLYWAISPDTAPLDSDALANINAYMKQGGVILFDTRDQINSFMPQTGIPGQSPLGRLLARLDIPRLQPVPRDHVLTRSFYLLDSFPGRWAGGTLWVEAGTADIKDSGTDSASQARSSDGVSSILITSNNLAAAWATDESGRTMFAVIPDGERQREMAYRTGINIVMYALTGNYKADQVHLPALMRRLGQ